MADLNLSKTWRNHEKRIATYIEQQVQTYRDSKCYRSLYNRHIRLRDSIDMNFHSKKSGLRAVNSFRSKICMPLGREAFIARRAITWSNFSADPLISLAAAGNTPHENAVNANDVLLSNYRTTQYRAKVLLPTINYCARYGAAVVRSMHRVSNQKGMKTMPYVAGGVMLGYRRVKVPKYTESIVNRVVNPLNYGQNPHVPYPEDSEFQYVIERWPLHRFVAFAKAKNEHYDERNLKKMIVQAQKDGLRSEHYKDESGEALGNSWAALGVDVIPYWGTLPIKGNEEDGAEYYVELAGDNIIRFELNPNDEDLRPVSTFTFDQRLEYWWGNTDTENMIPFENYLNTVFAMAADSGMRALQSLVFFDPSLGVNPADINNRAKNGGYIRATPKPGRSLREMFHQVQFPDVSMHNLDWLVKESKEAAQRVKPQADFQRQSGEGGLQNKTATAANILDERGDVQERYFLDQFGIGLTGNARVNMIMLQQYLPEVFDIRPDPRQPQRRLRKLDIFGDMEYRYSSAMTRNKQVAAQNLINWITAIQNFKGQNIDPTWQQVNIGPLVRHMVKQIDADIDTDRVYSEQQAMGPNVQSMMMPGAAPGQPVAPPTQPQAALPAPPQQGALAGVA